MFESSVASGRGRRRSSATNLSATSSPAARNQSPGSNGNDRTRAASVSGNGARQPRTYANLHDASRAGDVEAVQRILDEDASADDPSRSRSELIDARNLKGETPMYVAALHGHASVVEILLAAGADPNSKTNRSITALHKATMLGHSDVVDLLLLRGADLTLRDDKGRTAAELAVRFQKPATESTIRRRSSLKKLRSFVMARRFAAAFDDPKDKALKRTTSKQGLDMFQKSITLQRVRQKLTANLQARREREALLSSILGSSVGTSMSRYSLCSEQCVVVSHSAVFL